jgi:predicted phage terminase large subunit-like protein
MTAEPGFLGFAGHVLAEREQAPARHHKALIAKLEEVLKGSCDRLMVQMPPGSAKSTYASILFPAYYLGRHGEGQIIAASHTASLANHFGRLVRRTVVDYGQELGVALTKDSRAASRFATEGGGSYFAAGVRGPITGRRADLILIDDPIKSWAEADSLVHRDALYDWYRAEVTARLKPNGRIVLIMTRWHEDDLAGRLMKGETSWEVLRLPALAEENDPLGRALGEALWPEWQTAAALERRKTEVGDRAFAALYQQTPRPPDAMFFNTRRLRIVAEVPALQRTIRAWDLAAALPAPGRDPDYTVGLKLGVTEMKEIIVLDIVRLRATPGEVERRIAETAKLDGLTTMIALPKDPGQAGTAQVAYLTRGLLGYKIDATPETGSKDHRAMPAAAQMDAGNVLMLAAPWNLSFLRELSAFPDSEKDDQVDAFSRAVNTLATTTDSAPRRMHVSLVGR